jgi:membrane-associated phospholipid phosphatase
VAAAAALLRRLRLAAALVAATPLKVSLEAVAKIFVQRDRRAETLRGDSAAHGLSFPSSHAMVIFAIRDLLNAAFRMRAAESSWRTLTPTNAAVPT